MRNDWCNNDDVLEVHRLRGGSGVQQCIQPRQTNKLSLLELVVVQNEGGDDKTLESMGMERRKWVQSTMSQRRIKPKVRLTSTHQH